MFTDITQTLTKSAVIWPHKAVPSCGAIGFIQGQRKAYGVVTDLDIESHITRGTIAWSYKNLRGIFEKNNTTTISSLIFCLIYLFFIELPLKNGLQMHRIHIGWTNVFSFFNCSVSYSCGPAIFLCTDLTKQTFSAVF